MTGSTMVWPASSGFWKVPLAMHEVKMAEFCPKFVVIVVGNASYQQRQWQKKEANIQGQWYSLELFKFHDFP